MPLALLVTSLFVLAPAAAAAPQDDGPAPLFVDRPNATPNATPLDLLTGAATQDFSTLGTFSLPSGATITLEFDVTVNGTIPAGVSTVANQAGVGADQLAMAVASDDPTTGMSPDPTVTMLLVEADLGITKTDGAATSIPGQTIAYTVTVTNSGPFGVLDAEVNDAFPGVLSGCVWACGGTGNCDTTNGAGDINAVTVDLEAGQSVTFAVSACTIDPAATGTLSNTATVTPPGGVSDPGVFPNSATDDNTLVPTGDLSIDKTTNTSPVVPGSAIQYSLVVANSGTSDATGVDVSDSFPAAVTGITWSCAGAGGASCPNAAGAGNLSETVDLPAGGSLTYTVDGTVDAGASGSIMNTASLTVPMGFTDTDDTNDSDTVTDNLDPMIDVGVTKTTLTAPPIVPGAMIQYQIVVDNGGPSDALGVAVSDTFPGTLSNVSWSCAASAGSSCTAAGAGNLSDTVNVAAGGDVTYTVTATISPTATGTLTNTAAITPPMGVTDASDGDDSSTVMNDLVPQGDLSIDKQTLTSPVVAGQQVSYQIVVANSGPSTAVGAQVQDNFPAALANVSWTCVASAGSSCTAGPVAGDVLDMVTVASGGNVTYTVTGDLPADATGVLSNTATVSIPGGFTDTNTGNESDTVMDAISIVADLMILKQDGGAPVEPGDLVTYTIVVTNLGPSDVVGATVTDTVPAELTNVTWSCVADPGASCTAMGMGDINDSVDLPAGTSVTYTLTGDAPLATTTIDNTASVEPPAGASDPAAGNDSSQVMTMIARPVAVPTLSAYGLALLVALLAGCGLWLLRRRGAFAAGLALLLLVGFAGAADAQTLVDDFSVAQGPNADPPGGPPPISSTAAAGLGGERDLAMNRISGAGTVIGEVTGGAFEFVAPPSTRGEATLTWDGTDGDPDALDPVGLGNEDLTATGQSGFRLTVDAAAAGTELILRVFTDGSNHSQAARLVATAIAATTDVFIPFSEFRTVAGAGADFTDVGAVVLVVRGENVTATVANLETAGPLLVVEKVDLDPMTNTEIGSNQVAAGSTIRYRVTVTNSGAEATTVDVADVVDTNTTLVANTLDSTPVAVPDAYRWYGNVTLNVPALTGLLANDGDPDGDTIAVTSFDATSEQGGGVSVTLATGAFTYTPPAGFTGVDSFTYTIEDDDGNASTATATIALLSTIWFVDSDACPGAPPCGTGTQADPFGELEQAEAASGPNDIIRLRQGAADTTNHDQGIVLKAGQQLIGEGVDLVVDGVDIEGPGPDDANLDPNPANRPSLTHASMGGEGITLADGLTILGLNVNASMDSAIFGSNVDGVTIDHVAVIDSGGSAVEIANSTNLALTFTGLDSLDSFEHAVHLNNVTGTMTVTGTTQLDDPVMSGIRIESSPGFTASFAAVNVVDAGGGAAHAAIHLASNAGATLTFGAMNLDSENGDGFFALNAGTVNHPSSGNTVNAVGGAAVDIQSTTGNAGGSPGWSFDTLVSTSSPDHGVRLVSLGQDFNVSDASTTIVNPDVVGILVQNSGANVDYDFGPTSVTDNNVGAGATANGIDLSTGNSTATFTFDSLTVVTDGGYGLLANNSGTINIAGTDGNSIVATGGAALDVTSTGAGSGWTFDTLSSTNSTGTGVNLVGFSGTVTGEAGSITGAAGTAFNVDGGGPTVAYSGNVTQNAAQRVVNVEDTTGGSVTFNTGTVTGGASSLGVRINNADGNASFADLNLGTSGSPMTNQALTLGGGSTGTFGFAGTQIFTSGAMGVDANNGGVVEFTGAGNRVTTTGAVALRFMGGTTIGANDATFERIDASGGTHGIELTSTGSTGFFEITGDGPSDPTVTTAGRTTAKMGGGLITLGSGGTITNVQDAVRLTSVDDVRLRNLVIGDAAAMSGDAVSGVNSLSDNGIEVTGSQNLLLDNVKLARTADHGIQGFGANVGFTLLHTEILNAGDNGAGPTDGDDAIDFKTGIGGPAGPHSLTGTALIQSSILAGMSDTGMEVENFAGDLDLTVRNSFIGNNHHSDAGCAPCEGDGFLLRADGGSATIDMLLEDTTFNNVANDGVDIGNDQASNVSTLIARRISGTANSNADNLIDVASGAGTFTAEVYDLTSDANHNGNVLFFKADGGSTMTVTVDTEGMMLNQILGSAIGRGITIDTDGDIGAFDTRTTALVRNTQITNTEFDGLNLIVDDMASVAGGADVTLDNVRIGKPNTTISLVGALQLNASPNNAGTLDVNIVDCQIAPGSDAFMFTAEAVEIREIGSGNIRLACVDDGNGGNGTPCTAIGGTTNSTTVLANILNENGNQVDDGGLRAFVSTDVFNSGSRQIDIIAPAAVDTP